MNTVIFKWNPSFSSYSMRRFLQDMYLLRYNNEEDYDWSVWDYQQIHKGDRFYWIKVGMYGQQGTVGCGQITSEPYRGNDWSGKGRDTYYVRFLPEILLNPDALPLLSCNDLQQAIPEFEWGKGHSGLVLTNQQALMLDNIWKLYVAHYKGLFNECLMREQPEDLIYYKSQQIN